PAARKHFGQPVVSIGQISDYACRRRGGVTHGRVLISEHSFGNALDIATFTLAGGARLSLLKDWRGFFGGGKAAFLRDVQKGSCAIFSTSLSPRENRAHRNHFHFDMGRDGRYKYCK
ncbi:MAG TPA: extensin, partial [Thermopetrobacter sp.]|nr:extensin [Thermopetrobacter sp.]